MKPAYYEQGQRLYVFEDPMTRQKPEGIVDLVRFLDKSDSGLETWDVRFSDGMVVTRSIMPPSEK